jgi:hypothetical protein
MRTFSLQNIPQTDHNAPSTEHDSSDVIQHMEAIAS